MFDTQILGFPRHYDAERKILENVAADFPPDSGGAVYLYSEKPICGSCQGVIDQFERYFNYGIQVLTRSG